MAYAIVGADEESEICRATSQDGKITGKLGLTGVGQNCIVHRQLSKITSRIELFQL